MINVGSQVYIVPDDTRRKPYYAKVVKIGKKYIHVEGYIAVSRFNIDDHHSASFNDWNPRLTLYESERDYQITQKIQDKRHALISKIENKLLNTSLEKLEQIYKLTF